MRAAPLLHIGYVKTGSTWLQRHLFGVPATRTRQVGDRATITRLVHWPSDLTFDSEAYRAAVEPGLRACAARSEVPVVTHEIFAGNPIGGGWNATSMAHRLHQGHPDARVLVVIRRQPEHIASCYREYVQGGGAASFGHLTEPKRTHQLPTLDFAFWEYDRLIRLYRRLFGDDRVLVLPFEQLAAEPEAFCDAITDFAGADRLRPVPSRRERVASGAAVVELRRRANWLFHRESSNPAAPLYKPGVGNLVGRIPVPATFNAAASARLQREVASRIRERVPDRYAASNRRVAELTGLDLERWGYVVAPAPSPGDPHTLPGDPRDQAPAQLRDAPSRRVSRATSRPGPPVHATPRSHDP